MKKLNVAYFGTPYFSALFLEKMIQDTSLPIEIQLVVTRPDKPVGRKQVTTSSPVKQIALKKNIPVFDNLQSLKATDSLFNTCNIAFLYAYRGIIPKDLLNKPTFGFFNTHPSLLPKYRGPSPIAYPLMYGDIQTGVTLIKLDEEIDHGPIIMQEQIPILPTDRRPDLEMKLTDLTYLLFSKLVNSLTRESFNNLFFSPQDDKKATFTRLLEKKDGFIPFSVLQKVLKNEPLSQNELPQIIQENWKSKMINDKSISNFKFQILRKLYMTIFEVCILGPVSGPIFNLRG